MKTVALLPLVAVASAIVIPEPQVFTSLPIHDEKNARDTQDDISWLDRLSSTDKATSTFRDLVDTISTGIEYAIHDVKARLPTELEPFLVNDNDDNDNDDDEDYHVTDWWKPPHHGHERSNLTIYQLISQNRYTTKFAKLVDEYDDIVQLLNSTSANYTLFVPIDEAFERFADHKKPSKEVIETVLKYHIGLGSYPAGRIVATHTLPTALDEPLLGNKPQRLRTTAGIVSGIRVNFYSKVIAADIGAKNGVIHAVKSIIIPPPFVGRELSLFPSSFSTLLLAYDKTNFTGFIHGIKLTGTTVFAPDNSAFKKLGPRANAFLFNTEKGLGYLKAILKYHVVPNEVVYSDAYYSSADGKTHDDVGHGHYHLDVPTLLPEKNIAIDVARFAGFTQVKLNGYIPIVLQDAVAKNGVIHLPGRVLIPPHKHGKPGSEAVGEEMSVEELIERLADYVDESDKIEQSVKVEVEL